MFAPFPPSHPSHHAFGMHFPNHHAYRGGSPQPWMSSSPFGYSFVSAAPPRRKWQFDHRYMRPMEDHLPCEHPSDHYHYDCRPPPCCACGGRPLPPPPIVPHCTSGQEATRPFCGPPPLPEFYDDHREPNGHRHTSRHPRHHGRRHNGMRGPLPPHDFPHRGPASPPLPPQHDLPPPHSHRGQPPSPPPPGLHRGPPPPGPPSARPHPQHAPNSHGPPPPHVPRGPPCNERNPNARRPLHARGRRHRFTHHGEHHQPDHHHHRRHHQHHHHQQQQQEDSVSHRGRGGHGRESRHRRGRHHGHQHHHHHLSPHEHDHYAHCQCCPPSALPTFGRRPACDCVAYETPTISDDSSVDSGTDDNDASEDEQDQFEVVEPHQEGQHCEEQVAGESDRESARDHGNEVQV